MASARGGADGDGDGAGEGGAADDDDHKYCCYEVNDVDESLRRSWVCAGETGEDRLRQRFLE